MKVGDEVMLEGSTKPWLVTAMADGRRVRIERPSGAWLLVPESMLTPSLGPSHPPPGKARSTRR